VKAFLKLQQRTWRQLTSLAASNSLQDLPNIALALGTWY